MRGRGSAAGFVAVHSRSLRMSGGTYSWSRKVVETPVRGGDDDEDDEDCRVDGGGFW